MCGGTKIYFIANTKSPDVLIHFICNDGFFGSNYINMLVYISVVDVAFVYLVLIPLTLPTKSTKRIRLFTASIFILYMIIIYPNFKQGLLWGLNKMNVKY
jgi:hypothetical protein